MGPNPMLQYFIVSEFQSYRSKKIKPQISQMTQIFIYEIICEICGCFSLINSRSYVQNTKGGEEMKKHTISLIVAALIMSSFLACIKRKSKSPFCEDYNATRQSFKQLCDFISQEKAQVPIIFIGGYYMRTLAAGYRIFGNKDYLRIAVDYADSLLNKQSERGYWGTGYGVTYLADTGSAIALFTVLYKHVDEGQQDKYFDSISRYVTAIERDSLINPSGAIGVGWRTTKEGKIKAPWRDEYTISSALTGAQIFTWMYHSTREDKYRQVAVNALRWIMGTMREDGVIPHIFAIYGGSLSIVGDAENDYKLWEKWPYNVSAYVGEGLLAFDLYCNQPDWKAEIREKIKPYIEFLLKSQNDDGTWGVPWSPDQKRSPGVVNFLIWYYQHAQQDSRIVNAVQKFDQFLLIPEQAKAFGMINAGVEDIGPNNIVTAICGRAVADMLLPEVDAVW